MSREIVRDGIRVIEHSAKGITYYGVNPTGLRCCGKLHRKFQKAVDCARLSRAKEEK